MRDRAEESWGREPVGYRQGELSGGDGVAATTVVVVGGPALIAGALIVSVDGLSLSQVLLVAPVSAVLGGMVVGASARMSATTGANSAFLLRPSFGTIGARTVALVRVLLVAVWAIAGLQLVGGWAEGAARAADVAVPGLATIAIVLVASIGLGMAAAGLSTTVRVAVRRPLFWGSVALVGVVALQLTPSSGGGLSDGRFWSATERAVELAVVFVPFVQAVARRLDDDAEASTSFGVGYMVPATLMVIAGATFAYAVGGLPVDLSVLAPGTAGIVLAVGWVLVAEVDQAFAAFVGAGSELVGVIRAGPVAFFGTAVAVAVTATAVLLDGTVFGLASLMAAVAFPAALIVVADFFLTHDGYYSQAEVYDPTGVSAVNVIGMGCWIIAVVLGQLLDPIGPTVWLEAMPDVGLELEAPWRLLMALVGAFAYVILVRWRRRRPESVYDLRGVDHVVRNQP